MTIANPTAEALWASFPPSPAADVSYRTSRSASVADPQAWRTDGSIKRMATAITELIGCAEKVRSVSESMLAATGGDVEGLLKAIEHKREDCWFVTTAAKSTAYFVRREVMPEYKRMKFRETEIDENRAAFAHGTAAHNEWRRTHTCEQCDRMEGKR